ncbi:hypothetical protein C900_01836 [Fulvivirga imtechensis AK7]|uniref:eCIS core domain-containing protein n=1 Tax=Fulvivirga imtechensis AK7 TaxID=1237149 RepID=L8JWT9_9BACT|nr:DUF4157 domain-containing protein [Fulvivirga imtechensis]ELR72094.1 hypothetical protein C900_01836 [Fulvivirga imtechensis AK7]
MAGYTQEVKNCDSKANNRLNQPEDTIVANVPAPPKTQPAQPTFEPIHGNEKVLPKMTAREPEANLQMKCEECEEEERIQMQTGPQVMKMAGNADDEEGNAVQPKLKIGAADDEYEREADAVADQVMRMPDPKADNNAIIQRKPALIQAKCKVCDEEEAVQMKANGNAGNNAPHDIAQKLQNSNGGRALSPALQHDFGSKIGADFSRVKVHTHSPAVQMNRQLGARAFTYGSNIYFNQGEYDPWSLKGKHLLAHELTHVIQQTGNIQKEDGDEAESATDTERRPIRIDITAEPIAFFEQSGSEYIIKTPRWYRDRLEFNGDTPVLQPEDFVSGLEHRTTFGTRWDAEEGVEVFTSWRRRTMPLLPEAREQLLAGSPIPLEDYDDHYWAVYLNSVDLVRWYGLERWNARHEGTAGGEGEGLASQAEIINARLEGDYTVLRSNSDLSIVLLFMLEHFTALTLTDEIVEMASDGLAQEELDQILAGNDRRPTVTSIFTQAWNEYREAGGSDVAPFSLLSERIVEQYIYRNPNAMANFLKIGRGRGRESSILGIIQRNTGRLLYDSLGLPIISVNGATYRDAGYMGFDMSQLIPDELETDAVRSGDYGSMLVTNMFSQTFGVHDIPAIAQGVDAAIENIEIVAARVEEGLSAEVKRVVGQVLVILAAFMLGKATAKLLQRINIAPLQAFGYALELGIMGAEYYFGFTFISDTWRTMTRAAYHMSRVINQENGELTHLSQLHIELAARPIQHLIANMAGLMGAAAFGASVRGARAGTRMIWESSEVPIREAIAETARESAGERGTTEVEAPRQPAPESRAPEPTSPPELRVIEGGRSSEGGTAPRSTGGGTGIGRGRPSSPGSGTTGPSAPSAPAVRGTTPSPGRSADVPVARGRGGGYESGAATARVLEPAETAPVPEARPIPEPSPAEVPELPDNVVRGPWPERPAPAEPPPAEAPRPTEAPPRPVEVPAPEAPEVSSPETGRSEAPSARRGESAQRGSQADPSSVPVPVAVPEPAREEEEEPRRRCYDTSQKLGFNNGSFYVLPIGPTPEDLRVLACMERTAVGTTYRAFNTRNIAVARFIVNGQPRYVAAPNVSHNDSHGTHSEDFIFIEANNRFGQGNYIIDALFSERTPCTTCSGFLRIAPKTPGFMVHYIVSRRITGSAKVRVLRENYNGGV